MLTLSLASFTMSFAPSSSFILIVNSKAFNTVPIQHSEHISKPIISKLNRIDKKRARMRTPTMTSIMGISLTMRRNGIMIMGHSKSLRARESGSVDCHPL